MCGESEREEKKSSLHLEKKNPQSECIYNFFKTKIKINFFPPLTGIWAFVLVITQPFLFLQSSHFAQIMLTILYREDLALKKTNTFNVLGGDF